MDWFWTWSGESFGYREGDMLFTYKGKQAGLFHGAEIYGADGKYLGEVMNDNRLITNCSKKNWIRGVFSPVQAGSYARYANYAGYAMYAGHEDFPSPESF